MPKLALIQCHNDFFTAFILVCCNYRDKVMSYHHNIHEMITLVGKGENYDFIPGEMTKQ